LHEGIRSYLGTYSRKKKCKYGKIGSYKYTIYNYRFLIYSYSAFNTLIHLLHNIFLCISWILGYLYQM